MIRRMEGLNIFSEGAKKLARFYQDKVGLKTTLEAEMGENDEEVYGFEMGEGNGLYIMDHSKVKGKNSQPDRIIFNLEVESIEDEVAKLEKAGVKKIQDVYHVP